MIEALNLLNEESINEGDVTRISSKQSVLDGLVLERIQQTGNNASIDYEVRWTDIEKKFGWKLPGHGHVKDLHGENGCGSIRKVTKCRDSGRVQVKRNYCWRWDCPICFTANASKIASAASQRIINWMYKNGKELAYHFVVSYPNDFELSDENFKKERAKIYKHFSGGAVVFHAYRLKIECECGQLYGKHKNYCPHCGSTVWVDKRWIYGPHFHIVTIDNFVDSVAVRNKIEEWNKSHKRQRVLINIKNVKRRGKTGVWAHDLFPLFRYELTHASVQGGFDSNHITYFGLASYVKLKLQKINVTMPEICSCEDCGKKRLKDRAIQDEYSFEEESQVSQVSSRVEINSSISLQEKLGTYVTKQQIYLPKTDSVEILWEYIKKYYPKPCWAAIDLEIEKIDSMLSFGKYSEGRNALHLACRPVISDSSPSNKKVD